MSRMLLRTALLIAPLGLVGPVLIVAVPTSRSFVGEFVYDFTWFAWPTQMLAAYETSVGQLQAAGMAVGANVFLFAALGALAGASAGKAWVVMPLSGVVVLWGLFGAGYDLNFLNYPALAAALLFYAAPFALLKRGESIRRPAA